MLDQPKSTQRRILLSSLIILVVGLNVMLILRRSRTGPEADVLSWSSRPQEQQDVLLKWNTHLAVPVDDISRYNLQDSAPDVPCFSVPPGGVALSEHELTANLQADLKQAVDGLVEVIASNSPTAMLAYMKDRKKVYSPEEADKWRRTLVKKYDGDATVLGAKSDEEIFVMSWGVLQVTSHWKGLVPGESCQTVWRTTRAIDAEFLRNAQTLSTGLFEIFGEMRSWRHRFIDSSKLDLEEVLADGADVMIADVRVLIEHDADYLGQRSPYLFRFWLNPTHNCWQPMLLLRVGTFEDAPLQLSF